MHLGILSQPGNFHCEKWAGALAAAGAKVTVFSFDSGEIPGVETVRLQAPIYWGGRYRYPSYLTSGKALAQALRYHEVDVLHPLHLTPFATWGLEAGFKPMIAAAMGADVLEYPPHKSHALGLRTWREQEVVASAWERGQAWLRNRFYRWQVQSVVNGSTLLIADNQPLVDALLHWFHAPAAKVRLLRWGLEPEHLQFSAAQNTASRAEYGIAPPMRVVLSPRGANAVYQGDIIVQAFAHCLQAGPPDVFYLMFGAGYSTSNVVLRQAAALTAHYPTRFRFVPQQLPRKAVYALWGITDVFVSAPVYDGYSAAVAEGRYVGAIPIVNAIPGNLEIIQHGYNGWIVDPFTPAALAEGLLTVLNRLPELKTAFNPRNRAWIEEHSLLASNAAKLLEWASALL